MCVRGCVRACVCVCVCEYTCMHTHVVYIIMCIYGVFLSVCICIFVPSYNFTWLNAWHLAIM